MGQRIKVRRDSSANWTSTNPILQAGELGFESNTNKLKIGDGLTAWAALPYLQLGKTTQEGAPIANGTIAISTAITVAHNLGQKPDIVQTWLECVTASNGYAVGDRITTFATNEPAFSNNATNISIAFSSVLPAIFPKAGGAAVVITAANWKANMRSFKLV